MTTLNSRWG